MESKIRFEEKVLNKDRRFGSQLEYYPVIVYDEEGNKRHALFTMTQINTAIARADRNEEDIPKPNFWELITGELKESDEFSTD